MRVVGVRDCFDAEFFGPDNVLGLVIDENGFVGLGGCPRQGQMIEGRVGFLQVVPAGQDGVVEIGVDFGLLVDDPSAFGEIGDDPDRVAFSQRGDDLQQRLVVGSRLQTFFQPDFVEGGERSTDGLFHVLAEVFPGRLAQRQVGRMLVAIIPDKFRRDSHSGGKLCIERVEVRMDHDVAHIEHDGLNHGGYQMETAPKYRNQAAY